MLHVCVLIDTKNHAVYLTRRVNTGKSIDGRNKLLLASSASSFVARGKDGSSSGKKGRITIAYPYPDLWLP